jgi:hypothetical protein
MEELIKTMLPLMNEKQARLFLAGCANTLGRGGVKTVCAISGFSRTTVIKGKKELGNGEHLPQGQVRKPGGGRKKLDETYPALPEWIESIVSAETYGNPENPLVWTTKSLRKIQEAILSRHHVYVSFRSIATQLKKLGYSLQGNRKMLQVGESHPDRNAQFEHINTTAKRFIADGQPVISVDTKKKELIGNYANNGQEYRKKKEARLVLDHDFPEGELLKVAPYGVYVLNDNTAFVNLGKSHDTSEFAVESICRWWKVIGKNTFPDAEKLMIACDSGGSNGYRTRLWKKELQEFANSTGLEVYVSHLPPGTSKWNKVEHRLFCYITANWKATPLVDVDTVIKLISNTTTAKGLKVICQQDDTVYRRGIKISDKDFKQIKFIKIPPFGAWNYKFIPQE